MNRLTLLSIRIIASIFLSAWLLLSCSGSTETSHELDSVTNKILVFSATKGYRHSSIPEGIDALRKLGSSNAFAVEATENPEVFTKKNLVKYKAIVFLNTTGSFFNESQKLAFQNYIRQGGGFLGIHSAADTFYDWAWYGQLVGGYFKSHPEVQMATLHILDTSHTSTKSLPATWQKRDEWYNFKSLSNKTSVVISIDESTYRGGENGEHHPISWYHQFEGGRSFYTALGHTKESYTDERFLKHIIGALNWVMGDDRAAE